MSRLKVIFTICFTLIFIGLSVWVIVSVYGKSNNTHEVQTVSREIEQVPKNTTGSTTDTKKTISQNYDGNLSVTTVVHYYLSDHGVFLDSTLINLKIGEILELIRDDITEIPPEHIVYSVGIIEPIDSKHHVFLAKSTGSTKITIMPNMDLEKSKKIIVTVEDASNQSKSYDPYEWAPGIKEKVEKSVLENGYVDSLERITFKKSQIDGGKSNQGYYELWGISNGKYQCIVYVNCKTGEYHG